MARTSARDRNRFNWWRTIAIAFAIALHAGIIIMLLAPAAPPGAKKENKQAIVRVQFIPPPPPPPPPPEPPKQPPPKVIKIEKPPPMPPPPAPPPPQQQTVMSTPAAPPRPPAPPPPPADVQASIDISYKNRNPPQYPIQAMRQGHQGEVILDITVNATGEVVNVTVEKSSGYRELDRAAEEAARKWKFNPGIHNGKAAGGVVRVPVNFSLQGMM